MGKADKFLKDIDEQEDTKLAKEQEKMLVNMQKLAAKLDDLGMEYAGFLSANSIDAISTRRGIQAQKVIRTVCKDILDIV